MASGWLTEECKLFVERNEPGKETAQSIRKAESSGRAQGPESKGGNYFKEGPPSDVKLLRG